MTRKSNNGFGYKVAKDKQKQVEELKSELEYIKRQVGCIALDNMFGADECPFLAIMNILKHSESEAKNNKS